MVIPDMTALLGCVMLVAGELSQPIGHEHGRVEEGRFFERMALARGLIGVFAKLDARVYNPWGLPTSFLKVEGPRREMLACVLSIPTS